MLGVLPRPLPQLFVRSRGLLAGLTVSHPSAAWSKVPGSVGTYMPRGAAPHVSSLRPSSSRNRLEENRTLKRRASARGSTLFPARTQNGTLELLGGKLVVAFA
ncbi:hypothetical protein E2C01_043815 [Portunus trituberculatus]|uniref:Uncharacterized protein n=1 Tax=Portunus trituberculatus TaxID=210409 RepID=A0A5B7FYQ2_PORTR|nr:hypothetical protein [Portunus trituberculatus]